MPNGTDAQRTANLVEMVREIVEDRMGSAGITPYEGMKVAELVLWTLIENSFKLAQNEDLRDQARLAAVRVLIRLQSRVEAWPAKPSEAN